MGTGDDSDKTGDGGSAGEERLSASGEIAGYVWAVLPHGLIAVRRPDGSLRALPQADDPEAAVRAFIAAETSTG